MARTAKCRTISFKEEYMEAYEYLQSIPRASEYVCELILKDIKQKESNPELLAKQVEELLLKMEELKHKSKEGKQ